MSLTTSPHKGSAKKTDAISSVVINGSTPLKSLPVSSIETAIQSATVAISTTTKVTTTVQTATSTKTITTATASVATTTIATTTTATAPITAVTGATITAATTIVATETAATTAFATTAAATTATVATTTVATTTAAPTTTATATAETATAETITVASKTSAKPTCGTQTAANAGAEISTTTSMLNAPHSKFVTKSFTFHCKRNNLSNNISLDWMRVSRFFTWFSKNGVKKSISTEKTGDMLLSDYEVTLLQNSWKSLSADMEHFGRQIYRRVFDCEPNLKKLFPLHNINDQELDYNPEFRRQALAIIRLIDRCVKNVNTIESMCDELLQLGKRHKKLESFGFKPDHWALFKLSILLSVFVECESSAKEKHVLFDAWNTLISFIIEAMRYGYENDNANN